MLSSIFHLLPSTNLDIILQFYIRLWLNGKNEKTQCGIWQCSFKFHLNCKKNRLYCKFKARHFLRHLLSTIGWILQIYNSWQNIAFFCGFNTCHFKMRTSRLIWLNSSDNIPRNLRYCNGYICGIKKLKKGGSWNISYLNFLIDAWKFRI